MDKSNIVNVQLQEYQPVSSVERVDRGGWVAFGVNNLFPQYLRELSESSPVHGSLCISIGDMIAGKGITTNVGQDRIDALDVYGQYYAASHDFKKYGGYFVEVIYSNDRKSIAKLRHLPFEECRIAVEGEDEDVIGIYHSEDWANTRKKKNRPTFIPKFNPSMAVNEPSQVLWKFNYTSGQIYPNPDYWSAVNYIELERQIGMYHVNNIMNGLFPSFIISFFNGQIPPDQQWDMKKDWERLLTGARNAGKFLMTFNERETPKPDITSFPLSDADKQYQFLSEESTNKVMIAHRITTPLIFGIRTATGFGSNKDEMATGLEIFINQVIEPAQRLIIDGFTEILSFELPAIELTVIPNTPLTEQVQVDTTTGAPTDVAATALNGAQITSLVDIAMQAAAGAIPVTSAKAIVSAAFPTLAQAQVDAIFNSIVPGSLSPTEVIQSQEKKKTCCVSLAEESFEPTEEMAAEAELGLKWRDEFNRGGTEVGVARARDISNMRNLSLDTVKRMNSYFSRHEVDKEAIGWNDGEEGFPTAGRIAWQLWGGDAGRDWAARIVERVKKAELSESEVAEELIALGEDWNEDMILIDTYEVDYDTDDAENHDLEMIAVHELASTGTANPAFPSEQDEVIKGKLFMTRYVYRGVLSDNTREFCSKMLKANKLYRKEDIIAMGDRAVNKGWGPKGASTYDIWLYKGGGHCNHFWQKAVFMSAKGGNINPRGKDAQSIAVKKAESMGYKVRNEALVAKLPTDMDYHGFLPTNPVWGANGSAYK